MSMIGYLLRVTEKELSEYINNSFLLEERIDNEFGPNLLDIDKTWEGILYILTGHGLAGLENASIPLRWTIFGDHIVDEDQDLGYGPGNYSTPKEVKEISKVINLISPSEFRTMFLNADKKMRGDQIYPGILWPDNAEAFDYHFQYFELIKDFYLKASENGESVITFIS